jgi:hypothetical protein
MKAFAIVILSAAIFSSPLVKAMEQEKEDFELSQELLVQLFNELLGTIKARNVEIIFTKLQDLSQRLQLEGATIQNTNQDNDLEYLPAILMKCLAFENIKLSEIIDESHETVFHKACSVGNVKVTKIIGLADTKDLKNLLLAQNLNGQTASDCAQRFNHFDIVAGNQTLLTMLNTRGI